MIFARRVASRDDRGEWSEDFEGVEVPRAAKVALPFDDSKPSGRRRAIKARAALILRRNGFSAAETAAAIDVTPRTVQSWSALLREMATTGGRV